MKEQDAHKTKEQDDGKYDGKVSMMAKIFLKIIEELKDKAKYKEKIGRLIQDIQHPSTGDPERQQGRTKTNTPHDPR